VAFGRTRCTCCGIIVKVDIAFTRILDKYERKKKKVKTFSEISENKFILKRIIII
jgi:hypothetical protein